MLGVTRVRIYMIPTGGTARKRSIPTGCPSKTSHECGLSSSIPAMIDGTDRSKPRGGNAREMVSLRSGDIDDNRSVRIGRRGGNDNRGMRERHRDRGKVDRGTGLGRTYEKDFADGRKRGAY